METSRGPPANVDLSYKTTVIKTFGNVNIFFLLKFMFVFKYSTFCLS